MAKAITLGCKVKDIVTGFTGIVTSRHEEFTGAIAWGVQPPIDKKKPGEHPAAITIDTDALQHIGTGIHVKPQTLPLMPFKLGDEVEDRVSGVRGIAIFRSDFVNACTHISIQHKCKEGEKPERGKGFPLQGIKRIGDGINAPGEAPIVAKKQGGPSRRVSEF